MAGVIYHLDEPAHVAGALPLGERYELDFEPGDHVPRSEAEEMALEALVAAGVAERRQQKTRKET